MSPRRPPGTPLHPLRSAMVAVFFVCALILLTLLWRGMEVITDWYWFQGVGYESVFTITFFTQIKVAALFGGAFFAIFYLNLFLAKRFSVQGYWVNKNELIHIPPWESGDVGPLILLGSLLFGLFAALRGASHWEEFFRFFHSTAFGISDPLFGRDVGFYVFEFPFLRYLYSWLMTALALTAVAAGLFYFARRSFQIVPPNILRIAPAARKHLAHYRRARELLRQGDWAGFGDESEKMEEILKGLQKRKYH
jgi:uncharacterized membrane protein (UPF0182 family)